MRFVIKLLLWQGVLRMRTPQRSLYGAVNHALLRGAKICARKLLKNNKD